MREFFAKDLPPDLDGSLVVVVRSVGEIPSEPSLLDGCVDSLHDLHPFVEIQVLVREPGVVPEIGPQQFLRVREELQDLPREIVEVRVENLEREHLDVIAGQVVAMASIPLIILMMRRKLGPHVIDLCSSTAASSLGRDLIHLSVFESGTL